MKETKQQTKCRYLQQCSTIKGCMNEKAEKRQESSVGKFSFNNPLSEL
ncbi:hypothetical protein [Bacteroides fragilis]|nr:hypothetical protein [Bacteroides fragilis]